MTELKPRDATTNDIDEILRLAYAMWSDFGLNIPHGDWEEASRVFMTSRLGSGDYRILVIEDPKQPGHLIACGVGLLFDLTPAFWLPNGRMGYLQWFYTEPEWRKKGLSSSILDEFTDWFSDHDIDRVQLHAAPMAEKLYRQRGFENSKYPNLWWVKPGTRVE